MRGILSEHRHRYGGGVVRSFDPGSVTRGTAVLTSVCIYAVLKAVEYGQAQQGPRDHVLRLERVMNRAEDAGRLAEEETSEGDEVQPHQSGG